MNKNVSLKLRYSYIIGALLVMIMHCSGNLPATGNWSYLLCKVIANLGQVGVPWFFFMSAYFLFRGYRGDYNGLLKKRVKTLLIPYLVWNSIGYFFGLYVYNPLYAADGESFSFIGWLKAFIPLHTADGALWFVSLLIIYILLTPFFSWILSFEKTIILILALAITNILINITPSNDFSPIIYLPLYMLGGYVANHYRDRFEDFIGGEREGNKKISMLIIILVTICIAAIAFVLTTRYSIYSSLWIYQYMAPVLFVWLLHIARFKKSNWLIKNGSFLVYVSHGLLTNIYCPMVYGNGGEGRCNTRISFGDWNDYQLCVITDINSMDVKKTKMDMDFYWR